MKKITSILTVLTVSTLLNQLKAHGPDQPELHVNTRWRECSFQLDASLTKEAWQQFTREAGMVIYYRPLIDAKPLGKGRFEVSLLQWNTKIDERQEAWNNTFVHPHKEHWLIGGPVLPFPGISIRAGITRKLDAGMYWTMRPGANYGVGGLQLQYNIIDDTSKNWSASTRLTYSELYGPDDVSVSVTGIDALVSKKIKIYSNRISISPYAGISTYLARGRERSDVVDLKTEYVNKAQAMVGASLQLFKFRIGAEYNFANVNTFSYKLGYNFKF